MQEYKYLPWLASGLIVSGCMMPLPAQSQVAGDGTLGTQVNGALTTPCTGFCLITEGSPRGSNLFHSFRQFSLPNGDFAGFITTPAIQNVIVRVTGVGQPFISNINGAIATSNPTNFFLLNPNGIVFGPGARLNIGGSFLATTAERMKFQDGIVFSTRDPAPLLTINVPIGLQLGQTSGSIQANQTRLLAGQNSFFGDLALVGGNIVLDDVQIFTPGRRVDVAGVAELGDIGLNINGNLLSLSFPNNVVRADVSLTNRSQIDVVADGGGDIAIFAQNLGIDRSGLYAGIDEGGLGSSNTVGGNIALNITGSLRITNQSELVNFVGSDARGKGGNIDVNANTLFMDRGSILSSRTFGEGQGGDVVVNVSESLELVGLLSRPTSIRAQTSGAGNAGNLTVTTKNLAIRDGAGLSTISLEGESGKGGNLTVNANVIEVAGTALVELFGISIPLPSLITTQTFGNSDAGNLTINTGRLIVRDGARVSSSTAGRGRGGTVAVNASDSIELTGSTPFGASGIFSESNGTSTTNEEGGNAGNVIIKTRRLALQQEAEISTDTSTNGNAGDIDIQAEIVFVGSSARVGANTRGQGKGGTIQVVADDSIVLNDGTIASVTSGQGNAGDLSITTRSLTAVNSGFISTATIGDGNAGNLMIQATESVNLDDSIVTSLTDSKGNGGNLRITTGRLTIQGGGFVSSGTLTGSQGQGGNLNVVASESVEVVGTSSDSQFASSLSTESEGFGNAGNLNITTNRLIVRDGGTVSAETSGSGRGGNLTVNAFESVEVLRGAPNDQFSSAITAETEGSGDAGSLSITTKRLVVQDGGFIATLARGGSTGNAGNLFITVTDSVEVSGRTRDGDFVSGIAADVELGAIGRSGDLTLLTRNLTVKDEGEISVKNFGGASAGNIRIDAEKIQLDNQGKILAVTLLGQGGDITLNVRDLLLMRRNSLISTRSGLIGSDGNGGNITINAPKGFLVSAPNENNDINANAFTGRGGRVQLNAQGIYWFTPLNRTQLRQRLDQIDPSLPLDPLFLSSNDITASSEFGISGTVMLNTPDIDPSRGLLPLPVTLTDPSQQISQECVPRGPQRASSFVITGRGGLPSNPTEPLQSEDGLVDWVTLTEQNAIGGMTDDKRGSISSMRRSLAIAATSSPPTQLVEATALARDEKGTLHLVAEAPAVEPHSFWRTLPGCPKLEH